MALPNHLVYNHALVCGSAAVADAVLHLPALYPLMEARMPAWLAQVRREGGHT